MSDEVTHCPKCKRPRNEGNSPNAEECGETDDDEGVCEAYAKIAALEDDKRKLVEAIKTEITENHKLQRGSTLGDFEWFAVKQLGRLNHAVSDFADLEAKPLPKEPPEGLLMSMAIRMDHGLGVGWSLRSRLL